MMRSYSLAKKVVNANWIGLSAEEAVASSQHKRVLLTTENAFRDSLMLRFSPNPNLAGLIHWFEWEEDAFHAAREQDKPVMLFLSAFW